MTGLELRTEGAGSDAPGLRELVLHQQLLTPLDLEREYGLTEGCIFHGQMALDQLWFMRPVPGPAPYHTPIPNLFLCGAGSHPGGGVTGAPGGTRRGRCCEGLMWKIGTSQGRTAVRPYEASELFFKRQTPDVQISGVNVDSTACARRSSKNFRLIRIASVTS